MSSASPYAAKLFAVLTLLLALSAQPLTAQAPSAGPDIVVRGSRDRPSDWREAETDHVIVLSDGKQSELVRIAHNLERLHFLLSLLHDRIDASQDIVKLHVTLIGDSAEFDAMDLRNLRAQAGPYPPEFSAQAYYDPREDGAVAALSRLDHKLILQRGQSLANMLPDLVRMTSPAPVPGSPNAAVPNMTAASNTAMSFGGASTFSASVNERSVLVEAESRIYAAYARHFLITYLPAAYPRWYVDGFGELFSTIAIKSANQIDHLEYGRAPADYGSVINRYPRYPVAKILTGEYLADRKNAARRWTPYHAWVLTHMLYLDDARRPQLASYLAHIARGESAADAAQAFGDLDKLQRDLVAYDNGSIAFDRMSFPADKVAAPGVRQLTQGQAALVKGRLELGSRVEIPAAGSDPESEKQHRRAVTERDKWLTRLRADAAKYNSNLEAQLLLAEAECRSDNPRECVAAADRALALAPENGNALSWKGWGEVRLARQASGEADAARLNAARSFIARANRADPLNPVPLLAYYRSFAEVGTEPTDMAVAGLAEVVRIVPAAPGPRLLLADRLVQRGNPEAARKLLAPVARGAWASPETERALALLESASH